MRIAREVFESLPEKRENEAQMDADGTDRRR